MHWNGPNRAMLPQECYDSIKDITFIVMEGYELKIDGPFEHGRYSMELVKVDNTFE